MVLDWPLREDKRLREMHCDYWDDQFLVSVVDSVPASHPSSDWCGVTITGNLKLRYDLACPGDGLIAGADGITIDLNGHTISGSDTGAGIAVTGRRSLTIRGGAIRNFAAGLRVADSTDLAVKDVEFAENTDGVDLQQGSYRNTIRENAFRDNRSRGVMLRSDTVVRENTFTGNRVGVLLFGAVDTSVVDNVVSDSVLAGIRVNVLATGNLVRGNHVSSNPAGIEFLITPTGSAIGNTISANTIATNVCGIKGPVEGNRIQTNLFVENASDSCP